MLDNTTPRGVEAITNRREQVISQAFKDHNSYLLYYLKVWTNNHHDAENLLQDLWKHVLEKFDDDKIECRPLLRFKARQKYLDYRRKVSRRRENSYDEMLEKPYDKMPEVAAKETAYFGYDEDDPKLPEKFWAQFPAAKLTDRQKEVLWLHARFGLKYREIAEKLKVPASTIGDWIVLARKELAAKGYAANP